MPIGQQINMGQMLQQADPMALYNAKQAYEQAQGRESQSNKLANGQFGAAGLAGILANGLGALLNNKHRKTTDSAQSEYAKSQFESNQATAAQAKQQKAQALAEERAYKAQIAAQGHTNDMKLAGAKKTDTTMVRNLISQGLQPGTPEFQQAIKQQMNKSNAPVVNVNSGGEVSSEFQKKMAAANAKKFNEWEQQAFAANETMASLDQLNQINQAQSTGKAQEARALMGQYFGTEAASNMQAFNGIQKSLVLSAAQKLSGVMSDGDIKLLEQTLPSFGNDPRANQIIMKVLNDASQRAINRYENAESYVQKNGKMQGFKPKFSFAKRAKTAQSTQNKDFSEMSDDELIAAYKAQQGR